MKQNKRIVALLMALVMVLGLMAGCSSSDDSSDTTAAGTSTDSADSAESTQYTGEPEELTLPLTDETITITIYARNSTSGVVSDYGDIEAFEVAAERLGVEIEWIMPVSGSESDQFNLMIASGEYPDIIFWDFTSTPMGLTGLIDDGIIIDMDNLIRQYAPNYLAALESDEAMALQAISDDGTYDVMYKLEPDAARLVTTGPTIRKDLLDKYDLDVPVTIDDWYEVLTTIMENEDGVTAPVTGYQYNGSYSGLNMFMAAYNVTDDFMVDVDTGNVVYGPMTDNYKDYLTTMAQWYAEGLIDAEYLTNDYSTAIGNLTSGKSIAGYLALGGGIGTITTNARQTDPDFEFVGTTWPVLNEGDTQYTVNAEANIRVGNMAGAVTSACEYPEIAVKLMDYFYSEEGSDLLNWGIEGESYTVDEDGNKTFTDEILNNSEGKSVSEAVLQYAQPLQGFTKLMDYDAWSQITLVLPEQVAANETWSEGQTDMILPPLVLGSEENTKYNNIMADAETYMQEMTAQFIMGTLSIEDNWDTYIATLTEMGVDTCVEYLQAALDAYNARG